MGPDSYSITKTETSIFLANLTSPFAHFDETSCHVGETQSQRSEDSFWPETSEKAKPSVHSPTACKKQNCEFKALWMSLGVDLSFFFRSWFIFTYLFLLYNIVLVLPYWDDPEGWYGEGGGRGVQERVEDGSFFSWDFRWPSLGQYLDCITNSPWETLKQMIQPNCRWISDL